MLNVYSSNVPEGVPFNTAQFKRCKHHYYEFHVKLKGKRLDFYTSTLTTQCYGCLSARTKN